MLLQGDGGTGFDSVCRTILYNGFKSSYIDNVSLGSKIGSWVTVNTVFGN